MKNLLLMVGKSGSGKNFLCDALGFESVPSYTTRKKRKGEKEGVEHKFVSMKKWNEFPQKRIIAKSFFNNNWYWADTETVEDIKYDVYIVDVTGLINVFEAKAKGFFKRDIKVVIVKSVFYKRIYRMIKRDGFKNAIKRFWHDLAAFDHLNDVIDAYNYGDKTYTFTN